MKKSLLKILTFLVVVVGSLSIYLAVLNIKVYAEAHNKDHDEINQEWTSNDSLPSSVGSYYLANDVTISSTWYPVTGVKLCLNGHSITKTGEGSVIEIHGYANAAGNYRVTIYDCSEVEHKYKINDEGLGIVDDSLTENYETFKGGYITGGNSLDNGGCIKMYHTDGELAGATSTLSLNGVTLIGNKAAKNGGAIYYGHSSRKNNITYLNDVTIVGNVAGDTGGAIYREANNKYLALNNVNISKNSSVNSPAGILEESEISFLGKCYVYDNKLKSGQGADIENKHANQDKFVVAGKLDEGSKIGYTYINKHKIYNYYKEFDADDPTKNNTVDPNTIFISNSINVLNKDKDSPDDLDVIDFVADDYTVYYDGNPHGILLYKSLESVNATMKFRTEKYGEYNIDTAPEYTEVGKYVIYYKIITDYFTKEGSCKIIIDKEIPLLPSALTDLQYTGDKQELVTIPENAGATFKFKLENGYWSEYIPKGLNVGEYIIYVKATGDDDHANVEIELKASIVTPDKSELQAVIDIAEAYYEENDDDYKTVILPLWKQTALARAKVAMQEVSVAELQQAKDDLNAELEATKNNIKTITDVDNLISAIGEVSLSNESKAKIDTARTAYDALISAYQAFVKNYEALTLAEATYNSLKTDSDAANAVMEAINSIGEVNLDSKAKIDEVRASYDGLTDTQKGLVTNLETLTLAEVAYASLKADKDAAVATEAKISDIGEVKFLDEVKARIDEARASYDGLTDTQKGLVTNLETLTTAEATYATLKADSEASARVYALINSIGEVALTDEVKARIDEARTSYDGLTDSQKLLIENYDVLIDAEEEYATILGYKQKGEAVDQKIDEIGALVYTSECKAKIDAAKVIYKILPAEAKAFVTKYEILDSLDESYKRIDSVYKIIASIDKVELNNKSSQEIQNAKLAYNALSEEEKALVTNKDILTNAEKEYENLSANSNKNLVLILSIAGGSLLVVLLIVLYILFFFVFNSWTLVKYKQKRVFRIGRKKGKVRLMRMNFMILYRDEADVYKLKKN